jgi:DNA primase
LEGDKICICSSLKDALCLWSNTGIPALAIQGEGYPISESAVNELRRRYKEIYILLDNDTAGLKDGVSLASSTGFINLILPQFEGGKDVSDLYKVKGRDTFLKTILPLFNNNKHLQQ